MKNKLLIFSINNIILFIDYFMFKNSMIRKKYQFKFCHNNYNTYRKDIELLIALLYYEYIISFSVEVSNLNTVL